MKNVMLWAGAGQIGMTIARRMGAGMKIVVGDKKLANAQAIAKTMNEAGFDVTPVEMDLSSRASISARRAAPQSYWMVSFRPRRLSSTKADSAPDSVRNRIPVSPERRDVMSGMTTPTQT